MSNKNKNEQFVCLPTGYTVSLYSGIKCLCIMSKFDNKETLLCIPLSLVNVNYFLIKQKEESQDIIEFFGNDPDRVKTWNNKSIIRIRGPEQIENFDTLNVEKLNFHEGDITQILESFSHTPYTPFIITGEYHIINGANRKVALFKNVISWENIEKSRVESKIDPIIELFFDIETEVTTGEFPIPSKEGITCISYCINNEKVEVLTVLPAQELLNKYSAEEIANLSNVTICNSQMDLIENFIIVLLKCDRYISFNGSNFDIPFIIGVIERYDPNYWTKLSTIDGRYISVGEHIVETPVGPQIKKYISIAGIEHVDVINVFRRYYPTWSNHKLDTVGKELINQGKTNFTMRKYFTLIEEYKKGKPLSSNGLDLMKSTLEYSGVDTEILRKIYEYVEPQRSIATNQCGLTIQSWSITNEMFGLITKINPTILFKPPTYESKFNLDIGFYCDVKIFLFNSIAFDCIIIPEIKTFLSTIKDKIILNTLYSSLCHYSHIFDINLYNEKVDQLISKYEKIGNFGLFIYIKNSKIEFKESYIYSYDVIVIPSKTSYMSLNEIDSENYSFYKRGLSLLSKPLPKKLDFVLCQQIMKVANKIKNKKTTDLLLSTEDINIEKLLFIKNKEFFIDDFTFVVKVRSDNAMKYEKFLTKNELNYLQNGGIFIELSYLYIDDGNNKALMHRVQYPYKKDLNIIPDYYIELMQKHFESLNKIIKPLQTSKNKVTKKIIDDEDEDEEILTKPNKITKTIVKNEEIVKEIQTQEEAALIRKKLDELQLQRTQVKK